MPWSVATGAFILPESVSGRRPQRHGSKPWVEIGKHPEFGRADVVATHPAHGTVVVEVEGNSSRQREQAMYSALGQTVLMMRRDSDHLTYALAVPDEEPWARQLRKIPGHILRALRLRLYLVSETGVREFPADAPSARGQTKR